jgi:uncharacterized metal-binding protein YceD (DUF177 family)
MSITEFSREVRVDSLGIAARPMQMDASPEERAALVKRFDLAGLERLAAEVRISRSDEDISLEGRIVADVAQSCVVTGEPVTQHIDEPFRILFRPHPTLGSADEELELDEGELDVVFHDGSVIDVGEAVAETLALNLDPFPRAPEAASAAKEVGIKDEKEAAIEASPFAALAALKDKLGK